MQSRGPMGGLSCRAPAGGSGSELSGGKHGVEAGGEPRCHSPVFYPPGATLWGVDTPWHRPRHQLGSVGRRGRNGDCLRQTVSGLDRVGSDFPARTGSGRRPPQPVTRSTGLDFEGNSRGEYSPGTPASRHRLPTATGRSRRGPPATDAGASWSSNNVGLPNFAAKAVGSVHTSGSVNQGNPHRDNTTSRPRSSTGSGPVKLHNPFCVRPAHRFADEEVFAPVSPDRNSRSAAQPSFRFSLDVRLED